MSISRFIKSAPSIELFYGAKRDTSFGNIFIIGTGGIYLNLLDDTTLHIGEWKSGEVRQSLESLKFYRALTGYRNQQKVHLNELEMMIENLSRLFAEHPEIKEIDINPILFDSGIPVIVDAKFYL